MTPEPNHRELRADLLIGRVVRDTNGRKVGRIEEIRANDDGEVTEYLVGKQALVERLSALGLFSHHKSGYVIRWDQIDLSNPSRPRLTCDVGELERL